MALFTMHTFFRKYNVLLTSYNKIKVATFGIHKIKILRKKHFKGSNKPTQHYRQIRCYKSKIMNNHKNKMIHYNYLNYNHILDNSKIDKLHIRGIDTL